MKVIAITGKRGVGKTHLAKEMEKILGNIGTTKIFSFADPLRELGDKILEDFPPSSNIRTSWADITPKLHTDIFDVPYKEEPIMPEGTTPREFLISLSENLIKPHFGMEIWARQVTDEILNSGVDFAIIDDLRFPEEVEEIIGTFRKEVHIIELHGSSVYGNIEDFRIPEHYSRMEVRNLDGELVWEFDRLVGFLETFIDELYNQQ